MTEPWPSLLETFDGEHRALMAVLGTLGDGDFARQTNCPPWDLRELVVHIAFSACSFPRQPPAPAGTAHRIVAADYYRRAARATPTYRTHNVDQTQRAARRYPHAGDAVDLVESLWRETRSRLEALDPGHLMAGPAGVERGGEVLEATALRVADFFLTRVIAIAAHAADVAITLQRPPWTTPAASETARVVLLDLLGGDDPSPRLAWDSRELLIVATGRRPLTSEERDVLGERAERFPLLS